MKISSGLDAAILLSSWRSEPAAKFLAFANLSSSSNVSFNLSKSSFPINTSPRTIMSIGSFNFCGMCFIVFRFSVTSSPTSPLPLVAPLINSPFLYSKATDKPSIFVSTTYSVTFSFCIFKQNSFTSSKEKTSCKLWSGTACSTFSKPSFTVPPTFWVKEFLDINSGNSFSKFLSSFISISYSKSLISGASSS